MVLLLSLVGYVYGTTLGLEESFFSSITIIGLGRGKPEYGDLFGVQRCGLSGVIATTLSSDNIS